MTFQTDNNTLVQAHADGGVSSRWHHHSDRYVYGHLVEETAVIEYGPGGSKQLNIETGGFFHLPPKVVHRDINLTDKPQRWILSFLGTGPLVENVDGSDPK